MGITAGRDQASVKLSVSIDRPVAEAYEFLSVPGNFPKWASGLKDAVDIRFSERNAYGVLDHAVTTPGGVTVYVPLRVIPRGRGCELVLTLFRQPGMSEEKFAADAEWVRRDLQNAKRILEKEHAMSANSGPGYKTHPQHRITTEAAGGRVRVIVNGEVIADTSKAVAMTEGDYPVAYYVPREDVKMERLRRTSHQTYCPFKGHASYYSLAGGPENAVWSYEQPYDEMRAIKELLAFYPDKVDSISMTND